VATTKPAITVNGDFSDWIASELITTPANFVPGYSLYGTVQNDSYLIAVDATLATDPVIGAGTTIWLNTDQNTATGYSPFGSIGAEYNVTYVNGSFYLYTGAAAQNLVSATALTAALSPDGKSLEIAIPRSLVTPAGGTVPTNINVAGWIDNGAVYLPGDYTKPEYTITDPATVQPRTPTHKVAIVYSDTSAKLYFSQSAYSDLFMAAQNQARMAGVAYDVIDESKLTDINNLIGYDELIFPSMSNVDTAQLPAIMSALTGAVYNYGIGIITAGDFLTNDQTGAPLPGNSYANMETLLDLARVSGGNSGAVTVTANDVSNPIMKGYTAGQTIQTSASTGYAAYSTVDGQTADVLANQNVTGVGTLPGVVETKTGGTNVHFATTDLLGDSNLLSNVIQSTVLGTALGVTLHESRDAGIVAVRMDMDQAQDPADVSPASGPGIYDVMIPILQQWKQQYDFVGSYYIDIGDNPNATDPTTTNWAKSLPYYQAILATGGEIGTHSYTHLINQPTQTFTATTLGTTVKGSTTITLNAVPSFAGVTVGMLVTGTGLGTGTALPGAAGEGGGIANTQVTAVSGNTITISYIPGGYGTANDGTLAAIPAGTKLTFSIPPENTNFLQTTGTVTSTTGKPFTYDYEFNQSALLLAQMLGVPVHGAAIPGANETFATDQNILPYFQSGTGYTGYLTGGWTGVGSGYPSAIGYMSPGATDLGAVYIAPNMTFDFTEIQYEGKTVAQAEADWAAQFSALGANAAGTPVAVLPIHDYGVAAWNTTTDSATGSPYTTQMYTDFIAQTYNANYEFLTLEQLAARTEAQQKASIKYTTAGNTISATVTPDASAPDLGGMALDVINGGTNVIRNVTNWYAYNAQELFLPANGGSFTINLGTTQDDVTHIASLPMRADLLSVTGDGTNLSFSVTGEGDVLVDLGAIGTSTPVVTGTGASVVTDPTAGQLDIRLTGTGQHDVTIRIEAPPAEYVTADAFSADTGASATDLVTNTAAQTITGTLSAALAAGDVVQVSLDNGTTWQNATAATGSTTFHLSGVLLTGSGTLMARVANSNGVPNVALSRTYVLDITPPTETVTIAAMTADTGIAGDFITSDGSAGRTVSGTLSAVLVTDESLRVSTDGGATWLAPTVSGTTWSVTDPASHTASWTIEAQVVDLAGNLGPLATRAVTLDTMAPAAPSVPDLATASDSGTSSTDNITKVTTPTFTGTAAAGATVTLYDGSTKLGSAVATATGSWSIVASALANGSHAISATATDAAANTSAASVALTVVIDTVAPAAPSVPDLATASDSGTSSTDNITKVTTPTFAGTAEAGATVTLYDGSTKVGTGVASATGSWSIVTSALASGTHSIKTTATDVAGNTGVASAALAVTIDTTPPAAPSQPDLATASDSGTSNTDNITNVATPVFSGTAVAGSTVTLFDGTNTIGSAVATATGAWSITAATLADGVHSITAKAADPAGNLSAASTALSVTIDRTAPAAPALTGGSTSTLTGTGEVSDTVTILNGTSTAGTTTVGSNGAWSWQFLSGTTARTFTAVQTDKAGNKSAASGLAVTGTSGANTLSGGTTNDLFIGGAGADTFTFAGTFAKDLIADFAATGTAHGIIDFHASATLNSYAAVLNHATQVGTSVVISQDTSNTLTLLNTSRTSLSSADFSFA
jgi:serralysin